MKTPIQCQCGHYRTLHWRYGQMEGCSHRDGGRQCCCRRYSALSGSLDDVTAELLACVASCERDWALMDRIDLSLRRAGFRPARSRLTR
jgi:hypothetical protein